MRFRISHILMVTAGIALLLTLALALLSPVIRLSREIDTAHNRIINEFDHVSIRDSALAILVDPTDRDIADLDLPEPIAQTDPKYVHVLNGSLHIEYGGGFAHYGLIIDPSSRRSKITSDGSHYAEQKLVDHVYFYEAE